MAKEDFDEDETIDSMENMNNEKEHKAHHKHHAHQSAHHASHHSHREHERRHNSDGGKNLWIIASVVFFIAAILFMVLWLTNKGGSATNELTEQELKVQMTDFIGKNLIQPGIDFEIVNVRETNGVYELNLTVQGNPFVSYASKDGEIFFIQAVKTNENPNSNTDDQQQAPANTNVPKTAKPVVEVFVMSHCPYGTQIEKGLLPVVGLLGDKADIQIKFVNYAMHGQREIDEQLNQYCIQQKYPDRFYRYLQCFLGEGDTEACVDELGLNQATLDACISATDKEFEISKDYADKSTWRGQFPSFSIHEAENQKYGVQGSPTLVINGVQVSSSRDSESLKDAICNAFAQAPEECDTELSKAGPSAGFGFGTSGTDAAAAECGV
jgi:glutaredoxin